MRMRIIKVTTIGGGSAQARLMGLLLVAKQMLLLRGILLEISAVVTVADDGGATGRIRRLIGGPGTGDQLNVMVAVASNSNVASVYNARWEDDKNSDLNGLKAGHVLMSLGARTLGSPSKAVEMIATALGCQANIALVSEDDPYLKVRLNTGELLNGEHTLDQKSNFPKGTHVTDFWLEPQARISEAARHAIEEADVVLGSSGDPVGSVGACLKVDGVSDAIAKAVHNNARVGLIVPLFNRLGQSPNFKAVDYCDFIEDLISPTKLDAAFVNTGVFSESVLSRYAEEYEEPVDAGDLTSLSNRLKVYSGDYKDETPLEPQPGDIVAHRSSNVARHGEGMVPDLVKFITEHLQA